MTGATTYAIRWRRIPEVVVPGKRLGRHQRVDTRAALYPHQTAPGRAPAPVLWGRAIPILDQGDIGSCTGNAETGVLGTAPFFAAVPAEIRGALAEPFAVSLYSQAESLDGDGPYPPQDNGSSGPSVCQAAKNAGYIAGYTHASDVRQVVDALQDGPVILGTNWYDCIVPGQRVLSADLRWVPIEKLQVNDELIGFDESIGQSARYRRSRVTALGTKPAEVYEISTDQGAVCVSGGHLFVQCSTLGPGGQPTKGRQQWVRADAIRPGDRLAYFMQPYGEDTSWEAGWLAGFFDGEGTLAGSYQLNFAQALGPVLNQAVRFLAAKGYETSVKQYRAPATDARGITSRKPLANIYVAGGYHGALRFLGEVQPARLLADAPRLWEGKATKSRRCPPAMVQDVRQHGTDIVHSIGTTTQTLIVEGFLSHNSFDSPDPHGLVAISPGAQVRGGHEYLCRGYDPDQKLLRFDNSWGPAWGDHGSFHYALGTLERLLAEGGDCTVSVPLGAPAPQPVSPAAGASGFPLDQFLAMLGLELPDIEQWIAEHHRPA